MDNTPITNNVKNRFLPLTESVAKGLEDEPQLADFEIIKELGSGSFGRVYLVIHRETKAQYAIKAIDKRNKANIDGKPYFRREIEIMYKISHPNVVRLFSHFEDEINCYFLMEYISRGNLYGLISKQKTKSLDAQTVATLMRDIISAVYYLQNMDPPIIHRDIKPENALLDERNVVKLTDFGWSNYIQGHEERMTFCGTPIYLAPEMIRGGGHDEHVDIWCIGVLLFELLTGKPPFVGSDKEQLMTNIMKLRINWPRDINMDAKNLISKILRIDPKTRITLPEMLQHPFFAKYISNPTQYLIKPSNLSKEPFIVSKDDPSKAIETYQTSKPQTPPQQQQQQQQREDRSQQREDRQQKQQQTPVQSSGGGNREKKIYNRQRDISPVPMSKLNLEKLDKIQLSKLNVIMMKKNPNESDSTSQLSSNFDSSKTKKDYESLMNKYNDLHKKFNDQAKKLEDSDTKVKYLLKEKDNLLKELDEKEDQKLEYKRTIADLTQKLNDSNSRDIKSSSVSKSYSKKDVKINYNNNSSKEAELQRIIDNKDKEINMLKEKLLNYQSSSNNGNGNEDNNISSSTTLNTDESSSSSSNKNKDKDKDALAMEIERLKKELMIEKEKLESVISNKNQEIQKYKEEQKDIKETEGKKYSKLINKYEHMLTLNENENKKLKGKVKDLESKISKMNLSK